MLKYLFGLSDDMSRSTGFPEENINYIVELTALFSSKITVDDNLVTSDSQSLLYQVLFYFITVLSSIVIPFTVL